MEKVPITVGDIMTRDVLCVGEQDNLLHLLESMRVLRFRHTPVTDDGRLIGMLSERDLLQMSASSLLPNGSETNRLLQRQFLVRDVMIRKVISVSANTTLREAAHIMLSHRLGCLPVIDEHNVLVGLVTSSDFLRLVEQLMPAEL